MGATTMERGVERRLAAFGEVKTIAEWATDARAGAWAEAILDRLDGGMTPEQAIALRVEGLGKGRVKILAFGERKTLRDWADDFRAEASMATIRARLKHGWAPEAAISTRVAPRESALIEAFGEAKSLREWAADERAMVNECSLRERLKSGMDPERAIATLPEQRFTRTVTAFGETKDAQAWALDPRCTVTAQWLLIRVTRGLPPEAALDAEVALPKRKKYTAWGETKGLRAWGRDPRCAVSEHTLMLRLRQGIEFERAMGERKIVVRPRKLPKNARLVTAFGETKPLHAWGNDPRCAVELTTVRTRLLEGMGAEEALTTPPSFQPVPVTAWGETKSVKAWAEDPRCEATANCLYQRLAKGMAPEEAIAKPSAEGWQDRSMEAFGERRTLREWAEDARCRVSYDTLHNRVTNTGMGLERALTAPNRACTKGRFGEMAEAFGERKLLGEWTGDPRCVVSRKALQKRLRVGWLLERALTTPEHGGRPVGTRGKFLLAFGERKNMRQWARDPRCAVSEGVLKQRLDRGWDVEAALGTSALEKGQVAVARKPRGSELRVTAWGETRRVGAWARDPRCAVRLATMRFRLDKGWSPEEAMAIPAGGSRGDEAAVRAAAARATEPSEGAVLAWGERKTIVDWSDDSRAAATTAQIRSRIEKGWEPERAISTFPAAPSLRRMEAFGEVKSLRAWHEDSRTQVCMWTIRKRLSDGWGLQDALTTPAREQIEGGITAFGETKSLAAWALDPRCEVTPSNIGVRLRRGLSPEEAITKRSHLGRRAGSAIDGAVPPPASDARLTQAA